MKGQLQRLGISYAWEREIATCLPEYYRWNQWLFLKMLERDLAYRRRSNVNWCPSCKTVLANEQVVDGGCWRCGTPVETRELEQWFFRITAYADELLERHRALPGWPDKVLTMQRNWIGRSEGARVRFPLRPGASAGARSRAIEVFTTRIDTIYGANFLLLAPEHPLVQQWASRRGRLRIPRQAAAIPGAGSHRTHDRRGREGRLRNGPDSGQPVHERAGADLGRQLRAGRVRHRRGDGCAGARPARLRVRAQVRPARHRRRAARRRPHCPARRWPRPTRGSGTLVNSGEFDGLARDAAVDRMSACRRGAAASASGRSSTG